MRIAIIYAPQHRKLEQTAKALGKIIEGKGHRVDYLQIGQGDRPPGVRIYDYIYLGSVAEGTFGGKVPAYVAEYIKQCRGFENSKSAAFMLKRILGNNKGLKRLMAVLETVGSQVTDFQLVSSNADLDALADRLRG